MNLVGYKNKNSKSGYTLIETLVVASIITLIMSSILALVKGTQEKAKRTLALANQRQLQKAVELYYNDMGFYPPDVNRGWDPGISKALPSNSDLNKDCGINSADCPVCVTCPADWVNQVRAKWQGPYTASWPNTAPWGGKYDFNNWNATTTRYGCQVPPGVYIGTQRNYDESNPIPYLSEKWFFDNQQDADNCLNGESQLQLIRY